MKKSEDNAASPELRFEDAYRELEEIVDQLESGDLALDESMALFERGLIGVPGTPEMTTSDVSLSKNISLTKFLKL